MTEYVTYKVWDGCKAPSNLEYNGRLVGQIVPGDEIVDIDALLALADEIEGNDVTYLVSTQYVLDSYADRIREACGATADE